ncbi:unnamed protein product [Amoebophrya sp. A25]|nr:unnamed protein product [Amoebophrya sp. A25]|eukprot:GSA25T00016007001.1
MSVFIRGPAAEEDTDPEKRIRNAVAQSPVFAEAEGEVVELLVATFVEHIDDLEKASNLEAIKQEYFEDAIEAAGADLVDGFITLAAEIGLLLLPDLVQRAEGGVGSKTGRKEADEDDKKSSVDGTSGEQDEDAKQVPVSSGGNNKAAPSSSSRSSSSNKKDKEKLVPAHMARSLASTSAAAREALLGGDRRNKAIGHSSKREREEAAFVSKVQQAAQKYAAQDREAKERETQLRAFFTSNGKTGQGEVQSTSSGGRLTSGNLQNNAADRRDIGRQTGATSEVTAGAAGRASSSSSQHHSTSTTSGFASSTRVNVSENTNRRQVKTSAAFASLEEEQAFAEDCVDEAKDFLRRVGEPVTLFGETVWDRYLRYRECELAHRDVGKLLTDSLTGGLTVEMALKKQEEHREGDDEDEEDSDDAEADGGQAGITDANENVGANGKRPSGDEMSSSHSSAQEQEENELDSTARSKADFLKRRRLMQQPSDERDAVPWRQTQWKMSSTELFELDLKERAAKDTRRRQGGEDDSPNNCSTSTRTTTNKDGGGSTSGSQARPGKNPQGAERFSAVSSWIQETLKEWESDLFQVASLDLDTIDDRAAVTRGLATSMSNSSPASAKPEKFASSNSNSTTAAAEDKQLRRRVGKFPKQQYREAKLCLKPLRKLLKEQSLEEAILESLCLMQRLCEERNYIGANAEYMKLAIGNAAWPLGVTQVGIHERAARSAIAEDKVAHVLSDEATRKYIHSFKRLISYKQEKHPT